MPIEDDEDAEVSLLLTVADAKRHLNIDPSNGFDDALIAAKLAAASDWVAAFTGAEITEATSPRVKEAILMLTAHLYNNREAVLVGIDAQHMPLGCLDMLSDYRAWCA